MADDKQEIKINTGGEAPADADEQSVDEQAELSLSEEELTALCRFDHIHGLTRPPLLAEWIMS